MAKNQSRSLLALQYRQLIEAIRSTRERIHKLVLTGVIGMPSAFLLFKIAPADVLKSTAIQALLASSPLIVGSFGCAYHSERSALRRYGQYVRTYFDPLIAQQAATLESGNSFVAWETFTQIDRGRNESNSYERFRNMSILLVLVVYATVSCVISTTAIAEIFNLGMRWTVAIFIVELVALTGAVFYVESLSKLANKAVKNLAPADSAND
jgi:hypothetical protein